MTYPKALGCIVCPHFCRENFDSKSSVSVANTILTVDNFHRLLVPGQLLNPTHKFSAIHYQYTCAHVTSCLVFNTIPGRLAG